MVHAFVPQHLLDFAEYLEKLELSDENYDLQCKHRTIVNRAYLSTFLHANEWIINNGKCNDVRDYSKNSVGYHTAIHIALTKLNKRKIARKYKEFINLRVNADYNIVTIITLQDAQKAIDLAKEICSTLQ